MLALATSTTTLEPSLRMSAAAPSPLKRRITRPEPFSPRRKSMLATSMPDATRLVGSVGLAIVFEAMLCCTAPASTVSTSRLPELRVV